MKAQLGVSVAAVLVSGSGNASPGDQPQIVGSIVRFDSAFDRLVPGEAQIEKVAGGFQFTEGPLWRPDGHLWFSDVIDNVVRSVTPGGQVEVIIRNAGGQTNAPPGSFIGPNGMIADKDGYVLLCQHTSRRILRVSKDLQVSPYLEK